MNKIIEITTYIGVALAIWVISPLLGKFLDSLYFNPGMLGSSALITIVGVFIILLGTLLAIWTIYLLKAKGKGTPNPKLPPKEFVVTGPYRFSRNPMALGGFLVLLGEAVVYYSPSLLGISLLYCLIIYCNAVFVEEPELQKRFGESYEDYLKQVPRLFPNPWKRLK